MGGRGWHAVSAILLQKSLVQTPASRTWEGGLRNVNEIEGMRL